MNANHYRHGSWLYVLRNGIAVVVEPDAGTERIQQLWELLGRNPSVDQLLNEVTRSFGTSVTGLPDFAVVDHRDSLRVFLRGDLRVRTLDGSGQEVNGRGVTTWNERSLSSAGTFEIRAGQPDEDDDDPWMPLVAGVVTASVLVVGDLPVEEVPAEELPESAHEDTVEAPLFAAPAVSWNPPATVVPSAPLSTEAWDPAPGADDDDADDDAGEPSLDGQTDSLATELLGARAPRGDSAEDHLAGDPAGGQPAAPEAPRGAGAPDDESSEEEAGSGEPQTGEVARPGSEESSEEEPLSGAAQHQEHELPNDATTTYDHLWDSFQENSEDVEEPSGAPEPQEVPAADPGSQEATPEAADAPDEEDSPAAGGRDESQHTLLPASEADESLIDEVPWARSASPAPGPAAAPEASQAPLPGSPPSAPPLPAAPPAFPPAAPQGDDLDHDGHTVFRSELPPAAPNGAPQSAPAEAPANGPRVLARTCPRGHANPPTRTHCMSCEEAISGDAASVPRPALGRLRLPSGETVILDRNVILGRQPSVSRVSGGDMPHLVQVDSPKRDISRSHAEIRLEGWNVVLCDLNSSNGTVLLREGQSPRRLGQSETALVLSGDVAELGDQVYIVFEDLP